MYAPLDSFFRPQKQSFMDGKPTVMKGHGLLRITIGVSVWTITEKTSRENGVLSDTDLFRVCFSYQGGGEWESVTIPISTGYRHLKVSDQEHLKIFVSDCSAMLLSESKHFFPGQRRESVEIFRCCETREKHKGANERRGMVRGEGGQRLSRTSVG